MSPTVELLERIEVELEASDGEYVMGSLKDRYGEDGAERSES